MIEKIRGKVKGIFNLVGSFLARIPAYLIPIVASVVLVIVLCVLVLCLSDKWESCIPSKMVPDYKESDGRVSFFWNDFNFYGIVATVLALFSLWYTFRAYRSQSLTESNTRNVSIEDQRNKFKDFARHEYRNLVVVMTTAVKFFSKANQLNGYRTSYPSESHVLKLQAGPEDFVLDIDSKMAATVSEMRLLLRNYNIEIEVACKHLQRVAINNDALYRDYDNLIFKPLFLVKNACRMEAGMDMMEEKSASKKKGKDERIEELVERAAEIMLTEHLGKLNRSLTNLLQVLKDSTDSADIKDKINYKHYFKMLAKGPGMLFECDKTAALERSFHVLFGNKRAENEEYKPLLYTCLFNKYKPDFKFGESIDKTLKTLQDLEKISPEDFKWLKLYGKMLGDIKEKKEFDFQKFFLLMLIMDILVELPNIGMVNYEYEQTAAR